MSSVNFEDLKNKFINSDLDERATKILSNTTFI